jgi:hypothetical protein
MSDDRHGTNVRDAPIVPARGHPPQMAGPRFCIRPGTITFPRQGRLSWRATIELTQNGTDKSSYDGQRNRTKRIRVVEVMGPGS